MISKMESVELLLIAARALTKTPTSQQMIEKGLVSFGEQYKRLYVTDKGYEALQEYMMSLENSVDELQRQLAESEAHNNALGAAIQDTLNYHDKLGDITTEGD